MDRRRTRWLRRGAIVAGLAATMACVAWIGAAWNASRVPGAFGALELGTNDYGGGPPPAHAAHGGVSVATLRERRGGSPDVRIRLVAAHRRVRLPSGRTVSALTFNGTVPGPELRVRAGDLLEIRLANRDVEDGVSIHWHGVDLPNAEDGVAGVTQDAVPPGGTYLYRFRVSIAGTYWYHSHQDSAEQVARGLYGALVVRPRRAPGGDAVDVTAVAQTLRGVPVLGRSDVEQSRTVAPGRRVRLRLVNASDATRRFAVTGTPVRVVAIDARDLPTAATADGASLDIAAGGRYDVVFAMPSRPVRVAVRAQQVGIVFTSAGTSAAAPPPRFGPVFDPGEIEHTRVSVPTHVDRTFVLDLGRKLGFLEGGVRLGRQWSINGKIYPRMPMLMVRRGDVVKMTVVNHSGGLHPMHLHGHHMLVVARNGRPVRSPWWSDTLDVRAGETYDVVARMDNPGIWMLHCHNLAHAAAGLVTHLAYDGVTTPYRMGSSTRNDPE